MSTCAKFVLFVGSLAWATDLQAQPPSGRGEDGGSREMRGGGMRGGGPGGMMGGPGGMMGGPGGMMGGRGGMMGGPGGMMGGPGGMMGGRGGSGRMMGRRDRGGMPGGGRDRGGRGFAPPAEDGEEGQDRFARFEGMLRGFDANKDGVIDPNEVPEDRRRFLGFIGGRMGVDFSKPVAIDKLREKASERFGGGSKEKEPEPLVPGFGIPHEETAVLAFGERPTEQATSASANDAGGGSEQQNARAVGFANMMMRRYDRDGNGVLEKSKGEWEGVRGDPNEIDKNKDGRIDRNEMVARVAAYMGGNRGEGGGRGGERGGERDAVEASPASDNGRKSYRFLSAAERLPEGLPDWFEDRDRNRDGQVSMAEYSSYWSDSKAREYLRYDLNDDGLVTSAECLEAMSRTDVVATEAAKADAAASEGEVPAGDAKPEVKKGEKEESSGAKPWWQT